MLVDAGADLVIGHHPHCVQPIECYKGKYIFYSLGNSFFPDIHAPAYFSSEGVSEFTASVRWMKYGRVSLRVTYDVERKKVNKVEKLEYKKGNIEIIEDVKGDAAVPEIYRINLFNELAGYWRQGWNIIRSNCFVNGELINGKAFKKELEYIRAKTEKTF